ncbi:CAMK family protein kinase [Trichomonas vaginalis G3]|uniref:CAMK family protein kinase n=1 Tax=Trichomonas vaginalis (strain ATCC PRA-98 / G3) TaxID=412133 RepID=A2FIP0_TRIV3|nr:protein serine/threonine kinase protein [Trichomonas vaginalis G3]EAX95212.1 CAMK family protein kinase [Trichomonas vaginalis G3]KAI5506072.1 protein serine/threonine kinase protein [Trichomonas vaginalis G3]|eukprot:XP_001308142.1 CAMK family protein kinase [Trichomonas vaginalis G3]
MSQDFAVIQYHHKALQIPPQIGKYKIIKTLGKGGFAVVVLAYDTTTNQKVAFKVIDRQEVNETGTIKFVECELRLLARLSHNNIVKIYDIIYEPEMIMIVMEYLPNGDIQTLVNNSVSLRYDEYLNYTEDLLNALNYLHKRGIAHRDIKPDNILFSQDMMIKIIDFGLSKDNQIPENLLLGTPMYMAPELFKSLDSDPMMSDVWSLGVTLHIFMTGRYPWRYANEMEFIRAVKHNNVMINIEIGGILGRVLEHMLEVNPNERSNCQDLLNLINSTRKNGFGYSMPHVGRTLSSQPNQPKNLISLKTLALSRRMRSSNETSVNNRAKITIPYKVKTRSIIERR